MRVRNVLIDDFNKISTLMRYLYMSDEHSIEVENTLGVTLKITMGEDLNFYCTNMNFPDIPPTNWSSEMTINRMLDIIAQLEEKPAKMYSSFDSRWQEISDITQTNLALNIK